MPDKNLTDNEIVKALECCSNEICSYNLECPLYNTEHCISVKSQYALDLINRQNAEIEELVHKLECLLCHATGGKLSKHTYPLATMESYVNDTIQEYCEEAIEEAKAEAYKEFDERLKEDCLSYPLEKDDLTMLVNVDSYNNLLKEMMKG